MDFGPEDCLGVYGMAIRQHVVVCLVLIRLINNSDMITDCTATVVRYGDKTYSNQCVCVYMSLWEREGREGGRERQT